MAEKVKKRHTTSKIVVADEGLRFVNRSGKLLAQYARDMGEVEDAGHLVSRLTQRALDWAKGQIRDDMCLLAAIVR